jgi:hypothetical protein
LSKYIIDMNGVGRLDLIATVWRKSESRVLIFLGIDGHPFFDFTEPAFIRNLDNAAPDREALDVNSDNRPDIYIVHTDYG